MTTASGCIRLLPKLRVSSDCGTQPLANEAAAFADSRLVGRQVALEVGAERVDQYDRLLAYIGEPKTKKSRRTVRLTPRAVEALKSHRARQAEEKLKAGSLYKDNGLVFAGEGGGLINPSNLRQRSLPLLERAGLAGITFHDLRHTYASLLFQRNVHPKFVQELLGLDPPRYLLPHAARDGRRGRRRHGRRPGLGRAVRVPPKGASGAVFGPTIVRSPRRDSGGFSYSPRFSCKLDIVLRWAIVDSNH